jgi:flagellar motor switch protein FliG
MSSTTDNSLRKVAILVASLDEAWSERILASLSPQQARSVRQQVELLTDIHPAEQREIIAEFRRSLDQPIEAASSGVELDASLLQKIDDESYRSTAHCSPQSLNSISSADTEFLVEMLASESSQTIAVVLARLDADRAAEVLTKFSPSMQREILSRLEELDATDEHSIKLVEAQVNQWIANQRERRRRMAAGKEMVERIVSRTPQGLLPTLHDSSVVAMKMARPSSRIANEYLGTSPARETMPRPVRYEPTPAKPLVEAKPNPFAHLSVSESLNALEKMPTAKLATALSQCESQIVTLALVGASERLLKRMLKGLSRQESDIFRRQLSDIGPTRVSDILAAQHEVLLTASRLG